jgi:integrase
VYRRGDQFYALIRLKGLDPVTRTFPTAEECVAWANATRKELLDQRKRGPTRPDLGTLTLAGLISEFLADSTVKGLRSYGNYERQLGWWAKKYGTERVLDVTPIILREARERLQNGRQAPTVNRIIAALRSCWNWGRAARLVPNERVWPPRLMLREPKGRTRHLSSAELKSVLAEAKKHSATMHAAVLVSIGTGVRLSELLRLTWSDIDLKEQSIRVLVTKNDEARAVHLPEPAAAALQTLRRAKVASPKNVFLDEHGKPLNIFQLEGRWKKVRKAAGLQNFRWHDLRHTTASYLAQSGASLLEIASVLGHKNTAVTARYAHLIAGKPVTGSAALAEKLRGES